MRVLTQADSLLLTRLEAKVVCKWKWAWLKVESKCKYEGQEYVFPLSKFFSKIEKAGFARCNLCNGKEINYGKKGCHALTAHVQTKKHLELIRNVASTHSVADAVQVTARTSQGGLGTSIGSTEVGMSSSSRFIEIEKLREAVPVCVPLVERVANAEVIHF